MSFDWGIFSLSQQDHIVEGCARKTTLWKVVRGRPHRGRLCEAVVTSAKSRLVRRTKVRAIYLHSSSMWHYSHKLKACYTLFVTVRKQWRNYFFVKKIKFRETWQKEVCTLFVIDPSFHECVQQKIGRKKFFEFVKKLPSPVNAFCEKVFCKMLTNLTNHSLHTIHVSHWFCPFVPFSSLFANSV